ncbi:von Willebrand factor type A domain protein [Cooperia oncophora]
MNLKPLVFRGAVDPANDIRLKGVGYDKLTTVKKTYISWNSMAIANPFATLFCQYNPKCQKLDIIVVFDTSQSVVEPFIRNYANFSVQFISQYTLTGAVDGDNTRTGIISFSSDVKTVRDLGERSLDDFTTAVKGIHYTGGTTNTLAAMKAGRDMFKQGGGTTHGRTMVFLSDGQPYPLTPDTWTEIISVGSELKQMGVDIFFVGDGNGYPDDTRKIGMRGGLLISLGQRRQFTMVEREASGRRQPTVIISVEHIVLHPARMDR